MGKFTDAIFGRSGAAAAKPAASKVWKAVDVSAHVTAAKVLDTKADTLETQKNDLLNARIKTDTARAEARKQQAAARNGAPLDAKAQTALDAEKTTLRATRIKENAKLAQDADALMAGATQLICGLRATLSQLINNHSIGKASEKKPEGRTAEQVQSDVANLRAVREALSTALKAKATLMECQMPAARDQAAAKLSELPAKRQAAQQAKAAAQKALKESPAQQEIEVHARDTKNARNRLSRANEAVNHPPKLDGLTGEARASAQQKITDAMARKTAAEKDVAALDAQKPRITELKKEVKPLRDAVSAAERDCKALKKGKGTQKKFQTAERELKVGIDALKKEAAGIDRSLKNEDRSIEWNKRQSAEAERARAARTASEKRIAEMVAKLLAGNSGDERKAIGPATQAVLAGRDPDDPAKGKGAAR